MDVDVDVDGSAVAYWLRDLEMEKYNVEFARNGLQTFEQFTKLTAAEVSQHVEDEEDRVKMNTGIGEMKDFQFYYSATSSLLTLAMPSATSRPRLTSIHSSPMLLARMRCRSFSELRRNLDFQKGCSIHAPQNSWIYMPTRRSATAMHFNMDSSQRKASTEQLSDKRR